MAQPNRDQDRTAAYDRRERDDQGRGRPSQDRYPREEYATQNDDSSRWRGFEDSGDAGDDGSRRGARGPRPIERQRWDDDGGNRPSYERGGPDQSYYAQHSGWRGGDSSHRGEERWGDGWKRGAGDGDASSHRGKGPKNFARSDEQLLHEISQRLFDDHDIDASDIEVKVEGGDVTLDGTVPTLRMKRLASDCAEEIYGVSNCQNNLRVKRRDAEVGKSDGSSGGEGRASGRGNGESTRRV